MSRIIEDLQWFYKTLDIGGKSAEFYEAQKNIILQTLVILKKQQDENDAYNQALEDFYKALEKKQQADWIDNLEYGITFADVEEVIKQLKK